MRLIIIITICKYYNNNTNDNNDTNTTNKISNSIKCIYHNYDHNIKVVYQ